MKLDTLLASAVFVLSASTANALAHTFTYQGTLVDAAGNPLPDGLYSFTVVVSDEPEAANAIYSQSFTDMPLTNGRFTLLLGGEFQGGERLREAFTAFDFLYMKVILHDTERGVDMEFTPTIPITAAPYAARAFQAETLEGQSLAQLITTITDVFIGTGVNSVIGGGADNTALGECAVVSGGCNNEAGGMRSVVGGGSLNVASGDDSTIAGGRNHLASAQNATVGGGLTNQATGSGATVGGGEQNEASGSSATVPGGSGNRALGSFSFAAGNDAVANGSGSFCWADSIGTMFVAQLREFAARATGGFKFRTNSDATTGADLNAGSGTWTNISDKNVKQDIQAIDPADVLKKVAEMPISEWSYKTQKGVRHLGPMAQDFHAAFGLGVDDTGITSLDGSGVALAAIQGLHARNEELQARLNAKEARLNRLESELHHLRNMIDELAKQSQD